jgi:hypothetical protein
VAWCLPSQLEAGCCWSHSTSAGVWLASLTCIFRGRWGHCLHYYWQTQVQTGVAMLLLQGARPALPQPTPDTRSPSSTPTHGDAAAADLRHSVSRCVKHAQSLCAATFAAAAAVAPHCPGLTPAFCCSVRVQASTLSQAAQPETGVWAASPAGRSSSASRQPASSCQTRCRSVAGPT